EQIVTLQRIVRRVPIAEHLAKRAVAITRQTRPDLDASPEMVRQCVRWGAGPRAAQYMVLGAKARAVLEGRYHVASEDLDAVAGPVLRHRIITNFNAEAEGITPDQIIHELVSAN
ncbi:MAG: AAA family ATPase, partial [Planctomycetia bacterium]